MPHHDATPPPAAATALPPRSRDAPARSALPLKLSHAQMNAACDHGLAIPSGPAGPWIIRYAGSWWVLYEGGWLRVTDELAAADLDRWAAQMTQADADAARDTAIRAAVTGQPR